MLLRSTRAKLLIAVASVAVLAGGYLLKPSTPPPALRAPSEHPAPLLEEQAALRRTPAGVFNALQELAADLTGYTVGIPAAPEPRIRAVPDFPAAAGPAPGPSGAGVIVSATGIVLTHVAAFEGQGPLMVRLADGTVVQPILLAFDPLTDLVFLQLSTAAGASAAPMAAARVPAGTLAAAASRWNGVDTIAPVFVTEVHEDGYRFAATGTDLAPGMPLFTSEAELFGVAAGPARPGWAFSAREAVDRLHTAVSNGRALPGSLGLSLQNIGAALAEAFGKDGVLVADVIEDGPADRAGVRPGDVLLGVGDSDVSSAEAAQAAIVPLAIGATVPLRLTRDGALQEASAVVGAAFEMRRGGRAAAPPSGSPEAGAVLPDAELRAAGVAARARVLAVNGRSVSSPAGARREMRRRRPHVLYVAEGERRFFAAVAERP